MNRLKLIAVMVAAVFATFLAMLSVLNVRAQQVGEIKRNFLLTQDLSVAGHEGRLAQVVFAPGSREPQHTHPGDVLAYVQEGTLTQHLEGVPTVTVKPGDVFFVPAGKVHWAECGDTPCKALATFVVEKGKPLTSVVSPASPAK